MYTGPSRKDKQRSQTANKWPVSKISVWNGFTSGEKLGRFTRRVSKFETTFSFTEWSIWSIRLFAITSAPIWAAKAITQTRVEAAPWREMQTSAHSNKRSMFRTEYSVMKSYQEHRRHKRLSWKTQLATQQMSILMFHPPIGYKIRRPEFDLANIPSSDGECLFCIFSRWKFKEYSGHRLTTDIAKSGILAFSDRRDMTCRGGVVKVESGFKKQQH